MFNYISIALVSSVWRHWAVRSWVQSKRDRPRHSHAAWSRENIRHHWRRTYFVLSAFTALHWMQGGLVTRKLSVCPSVRPSVRPSVCPSVKRVHC